MDNISKKKKLENLKIIEKFVPHVWRVELPDGSRRILKFSHQDVNPLQKLRELIREIVVSDIFSYGGISNPAILRFHDLELCNEKDDYEEDWTLFDRNPTVKISNIEQFTIAFVIDWITRQEDRWKESKNNARLKKIENESYLFAPTDNGHSLMGPNNDWKPEDNTDSNYTSRLLFAGMISSRGELEKRISEFKSWPIKAIVFDSFEKLLNCGSSFSLESKDFILSYFMDIVNFIEIRKTMLDRLLNWYDETHQQAQLVAVQ